jgi:type I restriction enzyme, S subunit
VSFPRYPKYKDSGVEWLGAVPEHWDARRLSPLSTKITNGYVGPTRDILTDDGVRYLQSLHIKGNEIHFDVPYFVSEEWSNHHRKSILETGDVLIVQTGDIGQVTVVTDEFAGCNCHALIIVAPIRSVVGGEWISWVLNSDYGFHSLLSMQTGALHPHLNCGEVKDIAIPLPPLAEQTHIAAFLDRETAKIDGLVEEQRRLMELLKEKRQAIISHAVTQGLNPRVPMKPSGAEWLGDVPEHWELCRIGNVFREIAEAGTEELPILSVSIHHGVSDKEIEEEEMDRKVTRSDDRSKYKQVAAGDLVYNMMRAWQGGFGTVTVAGMVSPAYVVARPQGPLETAYVEHLLRTPQAIEQMRRHSRGVTDFRLRLYWGEFKNIRVALPPQQEAIAICAKISEMEERFNAMSAECEESITLLQERRIALISAAVTGQIDVRGVVQAKAA